MADWYAAQSVNKPEDVTARILFIGPRTSEALSLCATLENSSPERFRVLEVEGTDEGIALLHRERFHLLVLDDSLLMPTRRKSLEVLRQAAPNTPIILRTTCRSYLRLKWVPKPCCREVRCWCSGRWSIGSLVGSMVNGSR